MRFQIEKERGGVRCDLEILKTQILNSGWKGRAPLLDAVPDRTLKISKNSDLEQNLENSVIPDAMEGHPLQLIFS